jgi:oxazoline/thiazoline dehydrogenase
MTTITTAWRLRRDATLADTDTGVSIDLGNGRVLSLTVPPGVRAALRTLVGADATEADLGTVVAAGGSLAGVAQLHLILPRLDAAAVLEKVLRRDGVELARLRPVGYGPGATVPPPGPDQPVKLSRHAAAHAENGALVVAAPTSPLQVELATGAAGLLAVLADWLPAGQVDEQVPGGSAVLPLLAAAELLAPGGPDDDVEVASFERAMWRPADLWLHARVRESRLTPGYASSYPYQGRFEPLPAATPRRDGERIELAKLDLDVVAKQDPPFTEVLEKRRSVREHDPAAPITLAQLSELLYRTMRHRAVFTGSDGQQAVDRVFPAGGALHELEVYPLVTNCSGLEPGLWHYAAADHALERVAPPSTSTETLLWHAKSATMTTEDPQVLLLISARFGRLNWKYDVITYSLVHKHVGVLYQTMYLVATAMGLAVCGIGGGDAREFATATGIDYYTEGTVGELMIGSRPPGWTSSFADPAVSAAAGQGHQHGAGG